MIATDIIQHLARLARLELSGAELVKYGDDLAKILEYVGELQKVETAGVEPLHHVLGVNNVLREDGERILRDEQLAAKLFAMAPRQRDGFFVVPRILYHET